MSTTHEEARAWLEQAVDAAKLIEAHKALKPWEWYEPHPGQEAFHRSTHITRYAAPGNGWGKTTAVSMEIAWWIHRCHPWHEVPPWPLLLVWGMESYRNLDMMWDKVIVSALGPARSRTNPHGWSYNASAHRFSWPNGDKLFLVSYDAAWTTIQGIEPDLCAFDEEPPRGLWNELKMRRRGKRKTRYMVAATATRGLTWVYKELYVPWVEHHKAAGVPQPEAHKHQLHPSTWFLDTGGIADNAGLDDDDVAYYESQTFASEAERQVRLSGGFQDFTGTPVFDLRGLKVLHEPNKADGVDGWLLLDAVHERKRAGTRVGPRFVFEPGAQDPAQGGPRGRITVFAEPDPNERYVVGHDSAYGLEGGDFDYAVVLRRSDGRQVAEAQGRWGDAGWAAVLFALGWYYRDPEREMGAFLLGERQYGLPTMRRLMDEMGYGFQYFNREDATKARRKSDTLGHAKSVGDPTIGWLRAALAPRTLQGTYGTPACWPLSTELQRQISKFQFRPRSSLKTIDEVHDSETVMGAPAGDNDDGVLALAYANRALREVARFEADAPVYGHGTAGDIFAHLLAKTGDETAQRIVERRRPSSATRDPFARED